MSEATLQLIGIVGGVTPFALIIGMLVYILRRMDSRFDRIDTKFDKLFGKVDDTGIKVAKVEVKVEALEDGRRSKEPAEA